MDATCSASSLISASVHCHALDAVEAWLCPDGTGAESPKEVSDSRPDNSSPHEEDLDGGSDVDKAEAAIFAAAMASSRALCVK